jgi:hypothetical protein
MAKKSIIGERLREIQKNTEPKTLAQVAITTFKEYTPKASGNAKNKTRLKGDTIHADYAYAQRLDQGWSKQKGGVGMTEPTLKAIQEYLEKKV